MDELCLSQPDDWHIHLRDGQALARTVPDIARQVRRALVMPNLVPAITDVALAQAYRARICAHIPAGMDFEPCMSLYLTDKTTPQMVTEAKAAGIYGFKLYPAGATTHSAAGVQDISGCFEVFAAMEAQDLPLLVHGESTDPQVDVFDREKVFIEKTLMPLVERFPKLRVIFEHITTQEAVDFVKGASLQVAATITAHHLLFDRNAIFQGGIRPHYYCLPVLKRHHHQVALRQAAISGNPKFFMGSDSAPHAQPQKESACGCAGIYSAHALLPFYAMVFEAENALNRMEGFCSHFGADFYQVPRNTAKVTLTRQTWTVDASLDYLPNSPLIPLYANMPLAWRISHVTR